MDDTRIDPATAMAVTMIDTMKARGKLVISQACRNPWVLNGLGKAKAFGSVACSGVLKAIAMVTYRGTRTVRLPSRSRQVTVQLVFSLPTR